MYLQLAENETENYIRKETNQGGIYIRKDLAAAPKIIGSGKISGAVAKVAPAAAKAATFLPIPASGAVSTAIKTVGNVAAVKAASPGTVKPLQNIVSKLQPAIAAVKKTAPAAAVPAAAAATAAATAAQSATPGTESGPMAFIQKYKIPLLIGGAALIATGLILKSRINK